MTSQEQGLSSRFGGANRLLAWVWLSLAYVFPWIVVWCGLRGFIGYVPWDVGDTVAGMLALGLGWASGMPHIQFHGPLTFSTQLSAVAYSISGTPVETLQGFHDVALVLQLLSAILAAVWFGWAGSLLGVRPLVGLAASLVAASMPTLMLTGVAFTGYGPHMVWLPAGLVILAAARDRLGCIAGASALAVLGFCGANTYSVLPIVVAAVVAAFLAMGMTQGVTGALRRAAQNQTQVVAAIGALILLIALHSVVTAVLARFFFPVSHFSDFLKSATMAIPLALGAAAIFHFLSRCLFWLRGIYVLMAIPLLGGWLIGTNVWAPAWTWNALTASVEKGTSQAVGLDSTLGIGVLFRSVPDAPWILVLLLAPVAIAISWTRVAGGRTEGSLGASRTFTTIAVLGGYGLLLPLVGALLRETKDTIDAVIALRYVVPLIGPIALAAALYAAWPSAIVRRAAIVVCIGVFLASLGFHARAWLQTKRDAGTEVAAIDQAIDAFLGRAPSGMAVCLRTEVPERCAILFAYNHTGYRVGRSISRLPAPLLANGRIRFSGECLPQERAGCASRILESLEGASPILFLGHIGDFDRLDFSGVLAAGPQRENKSFRCERLPITGVSQRIETILCESAS
jgi:hypothetical protein